MTKKNIFLIISALLLASLSLYLNKDRFRSDSIQIGERWTEPGQRMARRNPKANGPVLRFLLDRQVKLTSLKVIPLSDIQTNKHPHPIWEMITDSNSVPVKDFFYGMPIRGMRPSVKGATADPLQTNTQYRLFVEAGSMKAEHDFTGPTQSR